MYHILLPRSEATYQLDARASRPGLLPVHLVDSHWLDCCRYQSCRAWVLEGVCKVQTKLGNKCGLFNLASSGLCWNSSRRRRACKHSLFAVRPTSASALKAVGVCLGSIRHVVFKRLLPLFVLFACEYVRLTRLNCTCRDRCSLGLGDASSERLFLLMPVMAWNSIAVVTAKSIGFRIQFAARRSLMAGISTAEQESDRGSRTLRERLRRI